MSCPLPAHLSQSQAQGLVENEPIAQFEIGEYRNFVYLILDWPARLAIWIDPQKDLTAPLKAMESFGFTLDRVLLTHTHFDHMAGVPELIQRFPALPISVHPDDLFRLRGDLRNHASLAPTRDEEVFVLGSTRIRTLHTPGHSLGECCYLVEGAQPYLLTGDTVFIRDCGNTSQPTGSNAQMFESLQKIKTLPRSTILLPGHHYTTETASTLEREMSESPPFLCRSVEELAALP